MLKLAFAILLNAFSVIWALFGWLYFYYQMDKYSSDPFSTINWQYYMWDKILTALLLLCAAFPFKQMRVILIITFLFYLVRVIGEMYKNIYDPQMILWLWIADISAIGLTIIWMVIGIVNEFHKTDTTNETDNVRIG